MSSSRRISDRFSHRLSLRPHNPHANLLIPTCSKYSVDIRSSDERFHRLPIHPPHDTAFFDYFLNSNARITRTPYPSSHDLSDRHVQPLELSAIGAPPAQASGLPGIAVSSVFGK